MNNRYIQSFCARAAALALLMPVPLCGVAADWNWTSTTVPASEKAGWGTRNWADQTNWGDGAAGFPAIATDAALLDAYAFDPAINRWQWITLPTPANNQQPAGYLGTLTGGFHNSIVLTSYSRTPNQLYKVANPNGFIGDWFIEGETAGTAACSGFILPATASFTPVLQRVRLSGGMQFKVATGGTAELAYPFGEGAFSVNKAVKNVEATSGTLAILRAPGPRSELRVYGGSVVLTGRAYADGAGLVPGAALHLDASRADTLTVDADGVSRWNDADGGAHYAVPGTNSGKPGVIANRVNNRAVVNFGAQKYSSKGVYGDPAVLGSPSRLVLDSAVEGVKEFFVVFEDASVDCVGPYFVNDDTYSRAAEKGRLFASNGMSGDRTRFAAVETADVSLNGQAIQQTLPVYGFAGRLHVVSVGHRGDYAGLLTAIGAPATDGNRWGGTHIAEIVAYTTALTPDQRRQNVAYLRRKWQAEAEAADLDYGTVVVEADATVEVSDGTTVEVGELKVASGVAKLVKTGGGTLVIDAYLSPDVEVEVRGGSVKFGTVAEAAEPTKAVDPLVWLDANTLTEASVTEWPDARGAEAPSISASREADTYPAATLDATTVAGKKMVDMGAAFSQTDDSTYFLIKNDGAKLGDAVRCGFMVYYKNVADAVVPSSSGNALRVTDGSDSFISDAWGNAYAVGGLWTLDGQPIDPADCPNAAGELHVIGFRLSSLQPVNMLGADRDAVASSSKNNRGGIKFGEVLLYDRVLSDSEWKDTESYLLKKWKGVRHPVDVAADQPLTLAFAGDADNIIDVASDRGLADVSLNGTKPVVKRGAGAVVLPETVASGVASYTVEGGSLQGAVTSAVGLSTLLSGAYYHADAMDADSLETTTVGDVKRVDRWNSASGQSVSATPYKHKNSLQTEIRPVLSDVVINGLDRKIVDFGAYASEAQSLPADGNSYSLTISSGSALLSELHCVACDSDSSDHTGSKKATRTAILGTSGSTSVDKNGFPIYRGSSSVLANTGSASAFAYGETWLNGESVVAYNTAPDFQQFYQLTMVPTGAVTSGTASWTIARRTYHEIGGLKFGEIVMYSATNSAADRASVDAYLEKKWFGTGDGYPWSVANLAVKGGSTLTLAPALGHTARAARLSGDGTVSVGDVFATEVVPGDGTLAGTLAVTGDLTLADGATLRIDLSKDSADKLDVGGKLTLAGGGTVRAERIAGTGKPVGDYVIAEASGGIVADDLDAWTVVSEADLPGKLKIVDGTKLVLSVFRKGLVIVVR